MNMKYYQDKKKHIDNLLNLLIVNNTPTNNTLKQALGLLFNGGKRLRPIISLEIANSINTKNKTNFDIDKIVLISEIIHSTSLIIDDLPCMDNDITRRGNPTIHYKYGETSAHILTMYLFSIVFNLMHDNLETLRNSNLKEIDKREELIIKCISDNLGIFGAPLGQYLDTADATILTGDKTNIKNIITDLLEKKTATFFEIAFVLGFVASGGDLDKLDDLRLCAKSFGIAFQISDDFLDMTKDASKCFCPNFVNHIGKEQAVLTFNSCLDIFIEKSKELDIFNKVFEEIICLLKERVKI